MTHPIPQIPYRLETFRAFAHAYPDKPLPANWVEALEKATGGKYHGHTRLDLGAVSVFLTDPRSCATRCTRTIKLHQVWKDTTVSAALLDLDADGHPLTLDLFPQFPARR